MPACPTCSAPTPEGSRFCPACAAPLGSSAEDATRTSAPSRPETSSPSLDRGRFIPGTVLAGRYRIIGLLGRGGMGEVYRADDLKLGQTVALKWLPKDVDKDPTRLDRFLGEVRHSLKVTHPNVCRVFDVGEVEGQHFLSMEFVDGEDLASLLRRIGRLPEDRAIQVARQLCAGLAAAHDEGVLHRDMKPANVMIDGRGRAKITDFGLAGATEGIVGAEARAGTPGYMAPEQIAGGELTPRTDIYALGLVLYELFTGKRAYEAKSPAEMAQLQETSPTSLSSHVQNLDPTVESIILRCVARDPEQRPASAQAVAQSLPGGDPLAAAMAAGETPSPEMIAAAGGRGGLSTRIAWTLLIGSLLLLGTEVGLQRNDFLIDHLKPEKSRPVLEDDARDLLRALGLDNPQLSHASGFSPSQRAVNWLRTRAEQEGKRDWYDAIDGRLPWLRFWYRQRDGKLSSESEYGYTRVRNPPLVIPGEVMVMLDHRARLLALDVVPDPKRVTTDEYSSFDWTPLLAATGFDPACLTPTEPRENPPVFADTRVAWEGECEDWPYGPVHIEAASLAGKPVRFHVEEPWLVKTEEEEPVKQATTSPNAIFTFIYFGLLLFAAILARRNLRTGRSDLRGANVILAIYVGFHTISILPMLTLSLKDLDSQFTQMVSTAGFAGAVLWLNYIALEPIVRKRWPKMLVSWSRLLQGGVFDPLVGRDVLIGAASAGVVGVLSALMPLSQQLVDSEAVLQGIVPSWVSLKSTLSSALWVLHLPLHALEMAMLGLLFFVFIKIMLRKTVLAAVVTVLIAMSVPLMIGASWVVSILAGIVASLFVAVVLRFGFLPAAICAALSAVCSAQMYSTNFTHWYGTGTLMTLLAFVLVAGYGFWVSLAGRPMFGNIE